VIELGLRDVRKSFGGRGVLDGLDLEVGEGARIGVIGRNGGGKSTLLRLAAGLDVPDSGEVTRRRGAAVAFLPQQVPGDERTPLETVLAARPDLAELEQELHGVATRIGELSDDLDKMARALARQEELFAEFTRLGGPSFDGRARPPSSRAASASSSPSRRASRRTRTCCCSTSRRPTSTPTTARGSRACCASSPAPS
jgi:ATPase subunit of ABC transporter with duplicated ATPase domains